MHRIDADAHVGNQFSNGDPGTGRPGTRVDADFMNALQEEIAGVIEDAGITLAKANMAQLKAAIVAVINRHGTLLDGSSNLYVGPPLDYGVGGLTALILRVGTAWGAVFNAALDRWNFQGKVIANLGAPAAGSTEAATAAYVDAAVAAGDKAHGWIYKELAADQTFNTNYADINNLIITAAAGEVQANAVIDFEFVLFGKADANGRNLFFSGSRTANVGQTDAQTRYFDWQLGMKDSMNDGFIFGSAPGTAQVINLSGVSEHTIHSRGFLIISDGNAVSATPQIKTSAGTYTARKGSYLRYRVFGGP